MCNKNTPDAAAEAIKTLMHALIDISCTAATAEKHITREPECTGEIIPHSLAYVQLTADMALNEAKAILIADAGSVEALLEMAERARLIKPSTYHHDDDLHFTGRMVSHYENGVEVSRERLRDDCCFGTLPEFIELLTSCGYQVIQGVNHG